MPFGIGLPESVRGEFTPVVLRIEGIEISLWKDYQITRHVLTPADTFRFTLGDEMLSPAIRGLLVAGNKVEIIIDGVTQMSGRIDSIDATTDRNGGTNLVIEGRDMMAAVIDSQIDPDSRYPEKTTLEKLLTDIFVGVFAFEGFELDNEDNVNVAANKALPRKKKQRKKLHEYKLPKSKPQHNDTYFQFLSRLTQRQGLWMWPTVDGKRVVVGKPDSDQPPRYQIRRKFDGRANNIMSGGVRLDTTDQPSFIVARGNIPPRVHEHGRMRVVIDSPYVAGLGTGLSFQEVTGRKNPEIASDQARGQTAQNATIIHLGISKDDQDKALGLKKAAASTDETGSFISFMTRSHTELVDKWTEVIPVPPITIQNQFSPRFAKPRFLRDNDSRTPEELRNFAKRQMSLCARRALVAKYDLEGHVLQGQPIFTDTVVDVDDEVYGLKASLYLAGCTLTQSRSGGTKTSLELIPLGALSF